MRRCIAVLVLVAAVGPVHAHGLLIPTEKKLPPLAMLNHEVTIAIDDQVAITRIEQTFRNHTDRQLEATYVFPVPKGASVRKFSMWVDGKEVPGELVEADKARKIYTEIVQRTLDPGLLEYMDNNLLKLRVFPVPPKGDQKIAISYTSVAESDHGLVEYRYPLKNDAKAAETLEKFAINVTMKSQHPLQNIYSPSHAITISRPNDREAKVGFEKDQASLDRDFQLFYTMGSKDVGLTSIAHRPSGGDGYFMLLVSPRAELSKEQQIPRDMVFVLDTSGSMRGKRIIQARNALKFCLSKLSSIDRFAIINFATTVNRYAENLQDATSSNIERAQKWVADLEATGGTAINDAMAAALDMRGKDEGRTFTVVFFTDGRPTIGETNVDIIQKNVLSKNTASTRIFTLGVGDDVNTGLLDELAERSRAVSTYVREAEDIENKVSGLYDKISHPVLANLKLNVGDQVKIADVYPPHLPDLFHGSQLVVLGRYNGDGHVAVKLTGQVGMETREFVYETAFPKETKDEKTFVEDLWARRKVGYMLDQIRRNGEQKELVDEVVRLAKRYGITTPYTSYLLVPDAPVAGIGPAGPPAVFFRNGGAGGFGGGVPVPGAQPAPVAEVAKKIAADGSGKGFGLIRGEIAKDEAKRKGGDKESPAEAERLSLDAVRDVLAEKRLQDLDTGKLAVDLAVRMRGMREQNQVRRSAMQTANGRSCIELGGLWLDENFDAKMATVPVKAMSNAYFRILERQPRMREVFRLGNYLVWVTPNGSALVIDPNNGRDEMPDQEIDRLFERK